MTISNALYTSFYGLRHAESQIAVTSQNVGNADKPGYTRKEMQSDYVTTNAGTVPINGQVVTVNYNINILKNLIGDTSLAEKNLQVAEIMTAYAKEMGSIAGDNSLSSFIDDLASAMDQLTVTPEDTSLKNQVIAYADRIASELNRLSGTIQDNRLKVDLEIQQKVGSVNQLLDQLDKINAQIQKATVLGTTTANLVDDRHQAMEELAKLIDFDYFVNSQDQLQIYTGGRPLLDSKPRFLSYTAVTALDKTVIYPAGFNPIDSSGVDMTTSILGGELTP